mgnify:CR=1 FL=1
MSASNQASHLAILFADISGSTRLYELLGDSNARLRIADCLRTLGQVVVEHGGKVVKTIGDEVMCTFPDVEAAVIAACGMQEMFNDRQVDENDDAAIALSLRIGLHAGPTLVESTDVFGDAVNVAARMVAQAKVGQIITTRVVIDRLPPFLRGNTRLIDHAPVKGKKDTFELFEVMWQQDDVTRMSPDIVVRPARRAELRGILRVLLRQRSPGRGRFHQPAGRPHARASPAGCGSRRHARTGGRPSGRFEEPARRLSARAV